MSARSRRRQTRGTSGTMTNETIGEKRGLESTHGATGPMRAPRRPLISKWFPERVAFSADAPTTFVVRTPRFLLSSLTDGPTRGTEAVRARGDPATTTGWPSHTLSCFSCALFTHMAGYGPVVGWEGALVGVDNVMGLIFFSEPTPQNEDTPLLCRRAR